MLNSLRISFLIALFFPLLIQAQSSQTFNVESFDAIAHATSGDVVLIQGDSYGLKVEGSQEKIDDLDIEVRNGSLYLKNKRNKGWNNWKSSKGKITFYVTFKKIDELAMSGSGSLKCENDVDFDDLELALSGSGNITLQGDVEDLEVALSGSGNIDAFDLEAENVEAAISGSGNIKVFANKTLEAAISGSGSIVYDGDVSDGISKATSGSGSVKKRR